MIGYVYYIYEIIETTTQHKAHYRPRTRLTNTQQDIHYKSKQYHGSRHHSYNKHGCFANLPRTVTALLLKIESFNPILHKMTCQINIRPFFLFFELPKLTKEAKEMNRLGGLIPTRG
jgi:hypothetical protein